MLSNASRLPVDVKQAGWVNLISARVNKLTNFISSIIYGASSLSTASTGGCVRPVKQVGVVSNVRGRSVENNGIILFPNKVISSHDRLVSFLHTSLKKSNLVFLNFFWTPPCFKLVVVTCMCSHRVMLSYPCCHTIAIGDASGVSTKPIVTEDGTEEWYIDKIVDACWCGHGIQYLVHYEGYGKEHDEWCPGLEMAETDALDRWEDENGTEVWDPHNFFKWGGV